MKNLPLFLLLAAASVMAGAQATSPQTGTSTHTLTAPHNQVRITTFVGFGPAGSAVPPKPNVPFSTVIVEQTDQTLNDGTHIARESQEIVMRDGMGRIYRARKIHPRGPTGGERMVSFTITDPVRHVQYLCSPLRKGCTKFKYAPFPHPRLPDPTHTHDVTEDLGSSDISGVEVEGKRVTREIAEGTVGNDRPFTTTEETWHSKALDVDVQSKHTDPRMGTRTSTMTEVSIGEPDPSYFRVPDGYRVDAPRSDHAALAPAPLADTLPAAIPSGSAPPQP